MNLEPVGTVADRVQRVVARGDGVAGAYGGSAGGGVAGGSTSGGGAAGGMAGGPGSSGGMSGGGGGGSPMMTSSDPSMPPDANVQQSVSVMYGSPPPDASQNMRDEQKRHHSLAETRGKDWAVKQKPPRATGVRRTIRVVVRNDQLPDSAGRRDS